MWIVPAARRAGVARRLLVELERTAREAGELSSDLRQTEHSARQSHFENVRVMSKLRRFNAQPYAHHWFEKTLGKKTQSGKVQ
jgi:GNAT superfamily N-acetyltransferase